MCVCVAYQECLVNDDTQGLEKRRRVPITPRHKIQTTLPLCQQLSKAQAQLALLEKQKDKLIKYMDNSQLPGKLGRWTTPSSEGTATTLLPLPHKQRSLRWGKGGEIEVKPTLDIKDSSNHGTRRHRALNPPVSGDKEGGFKIKIPTLLLNGNGSSRSSGGGGERDVVDRKKGCAPEVYTAGDPTTATTGMKPLDWNMPLSPDLMVVLGRHTISNGGICLEPLLGLTNLKDMSDVSRLLSPLNVVPPEALVRHVCSLRLDFLTRHLRPLLQRLVHHPSNVNGVFNTPVDPDALRIPNYRDRISCPMDFGTVKERLQSLRYLTPEAFASDVRLIFANAMAFNPPTHSIYQNARAALAEFEMEFAKLCARQTKWAQKRFEHSCQLCHGQTCSACGDKCLRLESPILMCHGPCNSRIKRGGIFYITPNASRLWCQKCFQGLPQHLPVEGCEGADELRLSSWDLMKDVNKEKITTVDNVIAGGECVSTDAPIISDASPSMETRSVGGGGDVGSSCDDMSLSSEHQMSPPVASASVKPHKTELLRRRFDCEVSEPWVQCDRCESWLHQVCALFNARANVGEATLVCPVCRLQDVAQALNAKVIPGEEEEVGEKAVENPNSSKETPAAVSSHPPSPGRSSSVEEGKEEVRGCGKAAALGDATTTESPQQFNNGNGLGEQLEYNVYSASSLPHFPLSMYLEKRVYVCLKGLGFADVAPSISVRIISSVHGSCEVPSVVRRIFRTSSNESNSGDGELPTKIPYRSKAICMFQELDGVDVCIFTMYVQEYGAGEAVPENNRRKVYIAYLDSIEYFRPRVARTEVYHEILISYLDWSRRRGFTHAHIWSCPPQRGNNFIFWCHPAHQRTPTRERLVDWYQAMLKKCKRIGIATSISNLHSVYFQSISRTQLHFRHSSSSGDLSGYETATVLQQQLQSRPEQQAESPPPSEEGGGDVTDGRGEEPTTSSSLHPPVFPPSVRFPLAPPIFDGDYWTDEMVRLQHLVEQKSDADFVAEQLSSKDLCAAALGDLSRLPNYKAFSEPVDPVAHKCPDYASVIQQPMDLGTVRAKLNAEKYATVEDFAFDVRLTFSNSMKYNPPMHSLHSAARTLSNHFERSMKKLFKLTKVRLGLSGATSSGNPVNSLKGISLTESIEDIELAATRENKDGGGIMSPVEPGTHRLSGSGGPWNSNVSPSSSVTSGYSLINDPLPSNSNPMVRQPSNTGFHALRHSSSFCSDIGMLLRKDKSDVDGGSILSDGDEDQSSLSRKPSATSLLTLEDVSKAAASPPPPVQAGAGGGSSSLPTADPASSSETASSNSAAAGGNGGLHRANSSVDFQSARLGGGEGTVQEAVRGNKMKWLLIQLCKSVDQMKRDLFVVELAAPDAALEDTGWEAAVEVFTAVNDGGDDGGGDSSRCSLVSDVDVDPDPKRMSALADSRHTLLEMCQFRHYQFDTLRRAKHSSAMVLYHLHRPQAHSLNPFCCNCGKAIRMLRFHCSKCSFDSCQECQEVLMCRCQEEHNLVPYQVTFVVNMTSEDAAQQQKSSLPLDMANVAKEG